MISLAKKVNTQMKFNVTLTITSLWDNSIQVLKGSATLIFREASLRQIRKVEIIIAWQSRNYASHPRAKKAVFGTDLDLGFRHS